MRRPTDRGATLVEYALIIALFVTVSVGAVEMLTNNASEEYAASGERIGSPNPTLPPDWIPPPDRDPIPVDPVDPGPGPDPDPDPEPDPEPEPEPDPDPEPQPATVPSATCSWRDCSFTVAGGAPNATYQWTTSNGLTGSGTSFAPTFPTLGSWGSATYAVTVTVTPGGQAITKTVACYAAFGITGCTTS